MLKLAAPQDAWHDVNAPHFLRHNPDLRSSIPFPTENPHVLYVIYFELRCYYHCSSESWEREGVCLLPIGQIPQTQLLRSPGYLANTFTASLSPSYYGTILVTPYYDTSRVPNYSRLQLFTRQSLRMVEYISTPPISRSFGLLSSGSSYRFLPHTVPSLDCLSNTPLATPGLLQTVRATSMLFRVYV